MTNHAEFCATNRRYNPRSGDPVGRGGGPPTNNKSLIRYKMKCDWRPSGIPTQPTSARQGLTHRFPFASATTLGKWNASDSQVNTNCVVSPVLFTSHKWNPSWSTAPLSSGGGNLFTTTCAIKVANKRRAVEAKRRPLVSAHVASSQPKHSRLSGPRSRNHPTSFPR